MPFAVQVTTAFLGISVAAEDSETVVLRGRIVDLAARARIITLSGCTFQTDVLATAHRWAVETLILNAKTPSAYLIELASLASVTSLRLNFITGLECAHLCACIEQMVDLRELTVICPDICGYACVDVCSTIMRSRARIVHLALGQCDPTSHMMCMWSMATMKLKELLLVFQDENEA